MLSPDVLIEVVVHFKDNLTCSFSVHNCFTVYVFHYREYLLGFRKRKNERRKKAQDDLIKKEKERRKELKQEVCCNYLRT